MPTVQISASDAAQLTEIAFAAPPSPVSAELYALSDLSTKITTLSRTRGHSWTETLNDAGSGELIFQNDDPDLALISSTTSVINFVVDGVLAFSMIPENMERTLIAASANDGDQVTKWSGRGIASVLDRACQYPALQLGSHPIEEDRSYNWTAGTYDFAGNGAVTATVIDSVTNAQAGSLGLAWDANFPDPGADVLGPSTGSTSASPIGECYYEQTVTVTADGQFVLLVLMKDYGEVYFDGALVVSPGQESNPTGDATELTMSRTNLDLTVGLHSINAHVHSDGGATGWAFTVVAANNDGTFGTGTGSSSVADGAVVIEYPAAPPGETPGQALLDFIDECQNGTLLGGGRATGDTLAVINAVTTSFDGTNDTDANAWTVTPEISTKIGTSALTFVKELSATYIDWYMAPGTTVLDAWIKDGRGTASGVDFHSPTDENDASTGNLTEHVETSEG